MPTRTDDPPRTRAPFEHLAESRHPGATRSATPRHEPTQEPADGDLLMEESFRAILSSHQRSGPWAPADEIDATAICGDVTLDFTGAELPPSDTIYIDARAICGEITIIVPDGAPVELEGTPILGSIEQQLRRKPARQAIREWVTGEREEDRLPSDDREPPCFRIQGRSICGAIKVQGR